MAVQRRAWEIEAPFHGKVVREEVELPGPEEVLVEAEWGAVSSGSEYLVYSGAASQAMSLDGAAQGGDGSDGAEGADGAKGADGAEGADGAKGADGAEGADGAQGGSGAAAYPLRYGYILTGRVSFCGSAVNSEQWLGRRVYTFHAHATHAVVPVDSLLPIPEHVAADRAPLYANLETALSLHWDAAILPGESVMIVGAGIVGMLAAAIAQRSGAGLVVLVDSDERRRQWAYRYLHGPAPEDSPGTAVPGVDETAEKRVQVVAALGEADAHLQAYPGRYRGAYEGFDVCLELTGNASVLNSVLQKMAFGGRVVVGSWYGDREAALALGGRFHRSRIRLISSQVSTLPLAVAGRIDYERRSRIVWDLLSRLGLSRLARRDITLDELDSLFRELSQGTRVEPWVAIRY